MSAFSDRPLVAGSVVGQRWFNVDQLGRLLSLGTPPVAFRPGVNEAVCRNALYEGVNGYPLTTITVERRPVVVAAEHQIAGVDCSCGYYAFFDNNERKAGVYGIIEGTGVCTVGTLGFRASRARLLALVRPSRLVDGWWDRVLHNYRDVPTYAKKREAREAHPLTEVDFPTPETCEDFWTRSV